MPNRGGFSLKRLTGISAAKARLSRKTGIPLSRSGRQAKVGRLATGGGCLVVVALVGVLLAACGAASTVRPAATVAASATPRPTATIAPSATTRPSATAQPTATATVTRIPPTITATATITRTATATALLPVRAATVPVRICCGATSKACGDSCIARDKVCNVGPGCACD